LLKSTLPQLKEKKFPSLEVQILNPKKAQFKISRSDFLNSISGSRVRRSRELFIGRSGYGLASNCFESIFDDAR